MTDTKGREILIEVDEYGAYASHCGRRIGEVTLVPSTEIEHGQTTPVEVNQMFVDREYERAGIGTALIEAAFAEFGVLSPPPTEGPNAMTPEGWHLIKKAIARGWVGDPFREPETEADE